MKARLSERLSTLEVHEYSSASVAAADRFSRTRSLDNARHFVSQDFNGTI
jgi:hypothetical protein